MAVKKNQQFDAELFPTNYTSWRYCIEIKCGLKLSPQFVEERIAILGNPSNAETRRFIELYGSPYYEQVLEWFRLVAAEKR